MIRVALLVGTLLLSTAACDKATVESCDKGCRNYFTLHYWEEAEREIAAAPEAEREALRAKKVSDLEPRMMQNLDICVQRCRSGGEKSRVNCWIEAKTMAELKRCDAE
jgi:hypothetical protein